ncbi:MAG: S41 family peptidase [Clostridiales bacterium]|nr:S41 family peptidase [Clostridiales bacterium]
MRINESRYTKGAKLKKVFFSLILTAALLTGFIPYSVLAGEDISKNVEEVISDVEEIEFAGEYLKSIMALISNYYVDDVSLEELVKGAVSGMAGALDEYSEFLDADKFNKTIEDTTSEHVGMGISYYLDQEDGYPLITAVYEGSPAEIAGVKKGDILISVDGMDIKGKDGDEITSFVSGKKGKTVKVIVRREGKNEEFSLKVDEFLAPTVFVSKIDELLQGLDKNKSDKVRYIQISSFADKTGQEFKKAVEKMKKQNVEGIILDLRFNGGGVTQSAYEICEILVKEGPFLNIKRKDGKYNVNSEDNNVPFNNIAILTNEATASASELVAAVLKDNGAAVVGSKTYGKGVTQAIIELEELGALKMTTEEFFPMSGRKINGVGIVPNYEVEQIKMIASDSADFQKDVETALKALGYDIATNEKKSAVIKEIQNKYSLKETGELDYSVISAINSEIINKNYKDDKVFEKAVEVLFGKL